MTTNGANDGAELIIAEINREAERQIEGILAEAKKEAESLMAEARERAELRASWILRKARTQAEIERQRIVAAAKLEVRKRKLEVQERLIRETIEGLRERLRSMPDDEYFGVLVDLLREAIAELGGREFRVSGNERTLRLIEEKKEELKGELGDVELHLGEPIDSMGGVVVMKPDGSVRVDNTFEARMERFGEELRTAVARALFGVREG